MELLRTGPDRPDAAISLELFDDIAWEEAGTPTELLQVKHHESRSRSLTDRSKDVWKTIQVWMDTASPGDAYGPELVLVTTQLAATGSAMAALRAVDRDVEKAAAILGRIAGETGAEETRATREKFLRLSSSERQTFLNRIRVADASPHAEEVRAAARACLLWALPRGHEELFLALVWQWWDEQALALLRRRLSKLDVGAAHAAIDEIRNQFTSDDLPTLVHLAELDETTIGETHRTHVFVQQLQWIAYPPRNLQKAIVDYYRAYTQSVRWLDEDLIGIQELTRFECELVDEWERQFEFMVISLSDTADDKAKQAAGTAMLRALLDSTQITVRPRYNETFFTRGQRHVLANRGRIGWHPDFESRVAELLLPAKA
ncbi:ABC-three component system protein [Nocardia sp. NPDC003345]